MAIETEPMLDNNGNNSQTVIVTENNNSKLCPDYVVNLSDDQIDSGDSQIELRWQNLSYSITTVQYKSISGIPYRRISKNKPLINNLCGRLVSGKLTAILGPNGAGKSTLLSCLAGRRREGLTGQVSVAKSDPKMKTRFAFYSQKDLLFDSLSPEEALLYASQLKSCRRTTKTSLERLDEYEKGSANVSIHKRRVQKLLKDLNLEKCTKTPLIYCSGGQRRRVSIALELMFDPSILLLDEPTSGLDSLTTMNCIQLLKGLSENRSNPMIIAVVIHQPPPRLLAYFDNLYIVSTTGQCIYEGSTDGLLKKLTNLNLECPQFYNPSDYFIEIATGDYGLDVIKVLAEQHDQGYLKSIENSEKCVESASRIIEKTRRHTLMEQWRKTWPLAKRSFMLSVKNPKNYVLQTVATAIMLVLIYIFNMDNKFGALDSCFIKPSLEYVKSLPIFDVLNAQTSPFPNWAFFFYSTIFIVFISILPTLLTFPLEIHIFTKENANGWYSLSSYFMAKNIADIPPNLIFPVIYCSATYIMTAQIMDVWRLTLYILVLVILSLLTQGLGFFVSAMFVDSVTASVIVGALVNIPLMLFAGLLMKIQSLPVFLQPLTYISYFRLSFESIMSIIYGFGRCDAVDKITISDLKESFGDHIVPMFRCIYDYDSDLVENATLALDHFNDMIYKTSSFTMHTFEFDENNLLTNILALVGYVVILRVLAYLLLVWRIKVR